MPKALMIFLWTLLIGAIMFAAYDLFMPTPLPKTACKVTSFSPYMQACN